MLIEDDLRLGPLSTARAARRTGVLLDLFNVARARARHHFSGPSGRRFLPLAERCLTAIIFRGVRPVWKDSEARRWGNARPEVVKEVYGMQVQCVRELQGCYLNALLGETRRKLR